MASSRKAFTSDGREYYEIRCRLKDRTERSMRWYVPEGWSLKTIERELHRQEAAFEEKCKNGQVLSKQQEKEKKRAAQLAAAKVKTLRDYVNHVFLPDKGFSCARSTIATYRQHFEWYVFPIIGDLKMPDISAATLDSLILSLQGKGLSQSTLKITFSCLNAVFHRAFMTDVIEKNPMAKLQCPRGQKDKRPSAPQTLSTDDLQRIKDCLSAERLIWQVFTSILMETGCRKGEALALRWCDIDLANGVISFNGSVNYHKETGLYRGSTKNGHVRENPIHADLVALLKKYRIEQMKTGAKTYLFTTTTKDAPMGPTVPNHFVSNFCRKNNLPHIHPHIFRHTAVSAAIAQDADVVSVAAFVGDTPAVILRTYAHPDKDAVKRVSDAIHSTLAK